MIEHWDLIEPSEYPSGKLSKPNFIRIYRSTCSKHENPLNKKNSENRANLGNSPNNYDVHMKGEKTVKVEILLVVRTGSTICCTDCTNAPPPKSVQRWEREAWDFSATFLWNVFRVLWLENKRYRKRRPTSWDCRCLICAVREEPECDGEMIVFALSLHFLSINCMETMKESFIELKTF